MAFAKSFGFYPYSRSFSTSRLRIEPRSDLDAIKEAVGVTNRILDGWFYPPIVTPGEPPTSAIAPLQETTQILLPTARFELPTSHRLICESDIPEDDANFLIVCFGFVLGMRLVPERWGHLYRVPVKEHALSDLVVGRKEVEFCLEKIGLFVENSTPALRNGVWSAINSFQIAQCYTHQFEEFLFQYITLDSVYQVYRLAGYVSDARHGSRPKAICDHLGIALPDWAIVDHRGNSVISRIRNNLFHEGVVDGGPIGFGLIRPSEIPLHLAALNMRALLYILGVDMPYVHSSVSTMQMHGLR